MTCSKCSALSDAWSGNRNRCQNPYTSVTYYCVKSSTNPNVVGWFDNVFGWGVSVSDPQAENPNRINITEKKDAKEEDDPLKYITKQDERTGEIEAFKQKALNATSQYRNGIYQSELWPSVKVHGETIYKSTSETANKAAGVPPKGIIPAELSMTVDGISDITIGEAFTLQKGILPKKYDDFGFIVVGVDQGIKSNRWYTTIRAQTFNIKEISETEKAENQKRIDETGFY